MITSVRKSLVLLGCLLAGTLLLHAVTPKFWEPVSAEDLMKGRLNGVSLSGDGKLLLAPQFNSVYETGLALVFALAAGPSNQLYLGTGHEGQVFKVDIQGNGTGKPFFKANEIDIFALACDASGQVYVGSSPDGKVYRVNSEGKATPYFEPKDKYIWDLALDTEGQLYIATGGKGQLYRVDRNGTGVVLFDSDEAHLMSLTFDLEGNVIAGSAPGGQVYRISRQGTAFVLLDTPLSEIRRVRIDRLGNVYALALSGGSVPPSSETISSTSRAKAMLSIGDTPPPTEERPAGGEDRTSVTTTISGFLPSSGEKPAGRSALYRIAKDGTVERLWNSTTEMAFDFVVRDDGRVLVGTGSKGRIIALDPPYPPTILAEAVDEQVTRMLTLGSDLYVATSNLGKLYRMQPVRSRTGEYQSDVFDAGLPASWGQISWKATTASGTTLEIYTRSGNTSVQNKTWSEWAGPYTRSHGEAVRSPLARYLQWKAVFKTSGGERKLVSTEDALEGVSIAYLQQNMRPVIASISVLQPGISMQKTPAITAGTTVVSVGSSSEMTGPPSGAAARAANKIQIPPRRVFKTGAQSFTWKASDENEDDLRYAIYFRGESESDWKQLAKDLEDDFYTIETNDLPDGNYLVKVVATDANSNAIDRALTGEIISKPFVINNTPPRIELLRHQVQGRRVEIAFRATDTASRIFSAEFSVDGKAWGLIFPKDGIADSREEEFLLTTPEIDSGEHVIGLRVTDIIGNVGTQKLVVKVP